MGLDERTMPVRSLAVLPDRLRDAGFEVEVVNESSHDAEDCPITVLKCRRGLDTQLLTWCAESESPDVCIYIANAWAWRGHVHQRRSAMQAEVTTIIEQNGGYF